MLYFLLLLSFILSVIYNLIKNRNYWRKRGVLQIDGVASKVIEQNCSLGEIFKSICDQYPEEPYFGIFLGGSHTLLLQDLKDIEAVLLRDFTSFHNRGIVINLREVLTDNLLFINDYKRWKIIKNNLTAVLSNFNMKNMLYYVDKRVQEFIENLPKNKGTKEDPFKGLYAYTASLIGASVFGIDEIPQDIDNSPLIQMLWNVNDSSKANNLIKYISNSYPNIFKWLNLKYFNGYNDYFVDIVKTILKNRRNQTVVRHDLIHVVLELQKLGKLRDSDTNYILELTDEVVAAQAFLFFIGGVDNISIVTHFTFLELASNKHVLEILHREIDEVFEEGNGILNFDDIGKFKYLDMIICEVLRMYPPILNTQRKCTTDTKLPSTQLSVKKGTSIVVPIYVLHRNPKYFPNPEVFDPLRFSDENKAKIIKYSYIPFGDGNRKCFGYRFARLVLKYSIASILQKYTLKEQKYQPKKFDPSFVSLRDVQARFELIPRNKA